MADIVTLGNGFCGSLSLFSSARYLTTLDQKHLWSVRFHAFPLFETNSLISILFEFDARTGGHSSTR